MSIRNPSITFFIATSGRKTLTNTLRSLYGQFNHGVDKVEVFFDGPFRDVGPDYFAPEKELYGDDLRFHVLPENLGYWGHAIRNTYQTSFTTDYVHNMDDDDNYVEGSMFQVRSDMRAFYGKVLIYKFRNSDGIQWRVPAIQHGNVGTPSGLIFNRPEIFGTWGYFHGGDAHFYEQVQNNIGPENIIFRDHLIVKIRPHVYGW